MNVCMTVCLMVVKIIHLNREDVVEAALPFSTMHRMNLNML